jgi:CheY-like chemotaxis protein
MQPLLSFVGSTTDSPRIEAHAKKKCSFYAVSRTVLIADDRRPCVRGVRFLLNRRRGELVVSEAVDGIAAIEKVKETKPDLILLDLAMPRMNGAEAASVLKSTLPERPIILFTMYSDLHADSLFGSPRIPTGRPPNGF